jgi:lipoic acid synthetase
MQHLPVERYVSPEEFQELHDLAMQHSFLYVASGPMVRSSYRAAEFFMQGVIERRRNTASSAPAAAVENRI